MIRTCKHHGEVEFFVRSDGYWRCRRCASEAVTKARKSHRQILLDEAGGCCQKCGYNKCMAALQFHHLDPSAKLFGISGSGQTMSLAKKRAEAAKCILLCANCHAEVEAQGPIV